MVTPQKSPRERNYFAVVVAAVVCNGVLVAAPAFASDVSAAKSSVIINAGTDTTATSDARIIHPKNADKSVGSQAATVVVSLKDGAGNTITGDTLTVSSSGSGILGSGIGSPTGFLPSSRSISVVVSSVVSNKYVFGVFGDGTGGFSTITIYDGQTLLATEFVAFYGKVASLSALQNLRLPNVNGTPLGSDSAHNPGDGTFVDTPAVILTARDANGIPTPDETASEFSAVSSDLSVLSPAISVAKDDAMGAGSLGLGTYNVQVRAATGAIPGKSATLTFRYTEDGVNYISSAPVTFTTASSMIQKITLSFNKESYKPGENAALTIRATDLLGNQVTGQDAGDFFASSAGLVTSAPITKLLFPFTTVSILHGIATTTFDLPTTSGLFTVTGRLGNSANLSPALQGLPISASVTILTRQDVELAAVKASADAAEKAANAALGAVTSLAAIVRALAAIVYKIQKKLGIK